MTNWIDPASPRRTGNDLGFGELSLGMTDSAGRFVGWIDEDGTCWESCRERDVALTAARWAEALCEWIKRLPEHRLAEPVPDIVAFAQRVCLREEHHAEAMEAAMEDAFTSIMPGIIPAPVERALAEIDDTHGLAQFLPRN